MNIGGREFDLKNHTYIMGILNITPDSFSDGGKYQPAEKALRRVEEMIEEGADIIDVGGESTRPGSDFVTAGEERSRIVPVIKAIKNRFDIPVSLDTYKAEVARAGIEAGADLINDIWGLRRDRGEMAQVISEAKLPCCLMHNRKDRNYSSFLEEAAQDLEESLKVAGLSGISEDKIILDPGIGFGKDNSQNLTVLNHLDFFTRFSLPLLLGASRKSVIGLTLELPTDQRLEGTLVTTVLAVQSGYSFVRVHDVKENCRAVQMAEAIFRRSSEHG